MPLLAFSTGYPANLSYGRSDKAPRPKPSATNSRHSLMRFAKMAGWRLAFVVTLLSLAGCGVTIVSDYCLRDRLILDVPMITDEIAAHNARYDCGCSEDPPEWCEE